MNSSTARTRHCKLRTGSVSCSATTSSTWIWTTPDTFFISITPRMIFPSHFLSSERMYIQYSRYKYGDNMKLAGTWPAPWGQPIEASSTVLQEGPYGGMTPDRNVVKLQAEIAF